MKNTDQALSELIRRGIEVAEKTGNFVIDSAPELIQEFYRWHIIKNILGILLGILILFVVYKLAYKSSKDEKSWTSDIKVASKWLTFEAVMFGAVGCVIGFFISFISIYNLIFILTAPKLYLIECFIK